VVLALIVFRIGSYIPVPGVNPEVMLQLMESQKGTIVDMFNMFSGGALHRFSLLALNVVPYISSSIIVQLMGQMYEPWKALKKEGEAGRRKLTQYSRLGAIPLAIFQSFGWIHGHCSCFIDCRHHVPDVAGRADYRTWYR
jgi:preprotein translocase subunit SecY